MKNIIVSVALVSTWFMPFAVGAEATTAVSPQGDEVVGVKQERPGEKPGPVNAVKPLDRGERLKNYTDRVIARFKTLLGTVERLNERAKTLLAKFEQAGRNVTRARADQVLAEKALTEARAAIDVLATNLGKLTLTKFNQETVQTEIERAAEALKTAHRAVVAVIRGLKSAESPTNQLLSN